ncbi:MAG: type I restriction endonuclease, partial [Cyclobacteriaceae bacterium]
MRKERATQDRIIKLFKEQLNYTYLGNWEEREDNSNIEESLLKEYLGRTKKYSDALINKAIFEIKKTAALSSNDDLYPTNKEVYSQLRYGVKVREEVGENVQTVHVINWSEPERNNFYVAEEVTVRGEKTKRPDIVLYINGIAVGVIELKRGSISVSEGIRQNLDNQQHRFIKPFFTTVQL